jgi:uncharacterized membrane protein
VSKTAALRALLEFRRKTFVKIGICRKSGRLCLRRLHLRGVRTLWLPLLLLGLCSLCSQDAFARPEFPAVVRSAYPLKSGGVIASAVSACTLCHVEAGPPQLNPFGKDVKAALDATGKKVLTPEILHSLDNKDSDGDGFTNGAEFAADTLPGDPASKPAGVPAPASGAATSAVSTPAHPEPPLNSLVTTLTGVMFPKHAQHPAVVHLPIGVFIISLLFDLLALRRKDRNLALAGYYNLTAAAVTSLMALATGLTAWWFAFGHAALQGTLLYHLVLACVTSALIWTLWWMRFRAADKAAPLSRTYIILGLIAFVIISITGHLGGNLTGVN